LLEHLRAPQLGVFLHFGGNLTLDHLRPLAFRSEAEHLHADQVDDAGKGVRLVGRTRPDGDLDRHRIGVQPRLDLLQGTEKIGPLAVHLVDEGDPRHMVAVGLTPDGLTLRFDSLAGAEHDHPAIQHA
jgi:hypothetical protein